VFSVDSGRVGFILKAVIFIHRLHQKLQQQPMLKKLFRYISLASEVDDFAVIHDTIEKGVIFRGTNLWILVFAIVVASVGLNMNSTAVIIGAMLISPLMGPINGMGYSLATYNFPLFRKSVRNFSFAMMASIVASTVYFAISPVSTAHSELLARTSPTIYDVLIAFFGGLAGIVAISSKLKGQVIPGVAIATALMPPLCTAGYGLATGQPEFFLGALYLFTINTVFIAIASVLITRILNFPILTLVDKRLGAHVSRWISLVVLITLVPSVYFGFGLVRKERFNENAGSFIRSVRIFEGNYLLRHEIEPDKRSISLIYGGISLSDQQKDAIRKKAAEFSLGDAEIDIRQGLSFEELTGKDKEMNDLKTELNKLSMQLYEKQAELDSVLNISSIGMNLLSEIQPLYPQINQCLYAESFDLSEEGKDSIPVSVIIFQTKGSPVSSADRKKIRSWLQARLMRQDIRVFYEGQD
jgi:uncharacterized hydrophobic protein (TIGR00271 family)